MNINNGNNILVEACAANFSARLKRRERRSDEKLRNKSTKLVPSSSDWIIKLTNERTSATPVRAEKRSNASLREYPSLISLIVFSSSSSKIVFSLAILIILSKAVK